MKNLLFLGLSAALMGSGLNAQSLTALLANTQELQVQLGLDQSTYFPGEAAVVTITVTNPTSGPLQVLTPFSNGTGCLVTYNQPAGGTPSPYGADNTCAGLPVAVPTTVLPAGARIQTQLNPCCDMFDFGGGSIDIPEGPGTYSVNYLYSGSVGAPFSVVVPHLDAAAVVQMADVSSIDPTTGGTVQQHSFVHLMALRSGNQSYIYARPSLQLRATNRSLPTPMATLARVRRDISGLRPVRTRWSLFQEPPMAPET